MTIRTPVSLGRFYSADADLLAAQVDACYSHPLGPGLHYDNDSLATFAVEPLALIVPHGALGHAGPIAAHAYQRLAAWGTKRLLSQPLLVILGPDHFGYGAPVSATSQDYASPFGVIPTDQTILNELYLKAVKHGQAAALRDAPAGHNSEHSVENQLPFIQRLIEKRHLSPSVRILPLTMAAQDVVTALSLSRVLDQILPQQDVILIATSDMAHCGAIYRNLPTENEGSLDISGWCRIQAFNTIQAICSLSAHELIACHSKKNLSLCGAGCVATALAFSQLRGATRCQLLSMSDSVAVANGWHQIMGSSSNSGQDIDCETLQLVDTLNPVCFAAFVID